MAIARYEKIQSHYYNHIWVVGDIHGCYTLLNHRLRELAFNKETDLLISVGDNIDRGTENLDVLRLLDEPWFISVIGNHEAMALEAFETQDGNRWLASGGDWFFSLTEQDRQEAITFLLRFQKIPHILEIESNDKNMLLPMLIIRARPITQIWSWMPTLSYGPSIALCALWRGERTPSAGPIFLSSGT